VAVRCAACGMAVGAQPGSYRAPHDEPLGFTHEDWLFKAILFLVGLLACAGALWFIK